MLDTDITYNPAYPQIKDFAMQLASDGVPADAQVIYKGRNTVYRMTYDGMDLCIKEFHRPKFINKYVYSFVRKSKARRSYDHAMRLLSMGILTPEPLACVELCKRMRFDLSYYVCRYLEADNVRYWDERPDSEALLMALGRHMAHMHSLGVWHKDFSPGNILVRGNANDGYTFYLVDINRMEFDVTDPKRLMCNFRSIHPDEGETARLARCYAAATGADPEQTARRAVAVQRRQKRKKRILGFFKFRKKH